MTEQLNNNNIISYSKGDAHLIAGKLSVLDNQNSCLIKQKGYCAIDNWNDQINMYQLSIIMLTHKLKACWKHILL